MKIQKMLLSAVLVVVVILAIVGALSFAWLSTRDAPVSTESESHNSQIITAIERQEQIVLLSASTQGLHKEEVYKTVRGKNVPGTGRTEFLEYTYRAKFGIEGGDVKIEQPGENRLLISIPEFIFLGHDNEEFKTAAADKGPLSWATAEIDTTDAINAILSADSKAKQIDENRDLLQDQAAAFYTGIINGIDNGIEIEFEFQGGA